MVSSKCQEQQLAECLTENFLANDELKQKFKEMRIKRSPNPKRQTFFEMVKDYFRNEQELCDWILNVYKYAKYMSTDELCQDYALANLELIKDHWKKDEWINCEFLLEYLLMNDPTFYDFEIFMSPKNLLINKTIIYDIIKKQSTN